MPTLHEILFNAHILYSIALGIWAASLAVKNEDISGNFWGAVLISAGLAGMITILGLLMTAQGYHPLAERLGTYYLYMAWLTIIMPGLFSMLRGRDDRSAAIAFAILAIFNATTSFSMLSRGLAGPWVLSS
ncbi:hypothetical protein MASR2M15_25660 [Anaerolineales bacterium]